MRFRFLSLLALVLILCAVLVACGDAAPTTVDPTQGVAATPTARPTVKPTIAIATAAAQPTATVKITQYLAPYGCLPAVTIKEVVVQACMDKPNPNQNNTVQLTTRMSMDGVAVTGAPVKTTWNFKSGKKQCATTSDKDGVGFCYQNIGTAEVGFRVLVEVQYDYKGAGHRAETSFTPIASALGNSTGA